MNSSKFTKMNAPRFSLGKFEAVVCGRIFNSVNTLLKMSLDRSHIFRTVAYSKVINIREPSVLLSRQLTMLFILY